MTWIIQNRHPRKLIQYVFVSMFIYLNRVSCSFASILFLINWRSNLFFVQSWIGNLFLLDYGELWAIVFISYTPSTFNFADVIYYNIFFVHPISQHTSQYNKRSIFIFTFYVMGAVCFLCVFLCNLVMWCRAQWLR